MVIIKLYLFVLDDDDVTKVEVGGIGDRQRIRGTGNRRGEENMVGRKQWATYYEIVAYSRGYLCECVGVAGRDEDDVCPATELDVQYRISDAVVWLRVRPSSGR